MGTNLKRHLHCSRSLPYATLIVLTIAAYSSSLPNTFLWDDIWLITQNQFLRSWQAIGQIFSTPIMAGASHAGSYYRPIQILAYAAIARTLGTQPLGFHVLNLALHAANACLVYKLGCKLGLRRTAVFVGAMLWSLHPIQTEAVTYISATADPLYTLFCLLGLLILLPTYSSPRVLIASATFLLALLSKESAIIFPLLALGNLFLISPERAKLRKYICVWPFFLILIAYIVLRLEVLDFDGLKLYTVASLYTAHVSVRILTFFAALPIYAKLLIWPAGLHPERQFPYFDSVWNPLVITGFLGASCVVALGFWRRMRRHLSAYWGVYWFVAAIAPSSGITFVLNSNLMEHWLYLPSIGLFLAASDCAEAAIEQVRVTWKRPVICIATILVVALFVALTFRQNQTWFDQITLYENVVKYESGSERTYNNLGMAYAERGDFPRATKNLRRAIQISDTLPEAHHNLARVMLQEPDWTAHSDLIIAELQRSLEIDPKFYPSIKQLEKIYRYLGKNDQAELYRLRAVSVQKNYSE